MGLYWILNKSTGKGYAGQANKNRGKERMYEHLENAYQANKPYDSGAKPILISGACDCEWRYWEETSNDIFAETRKALLQSGWHIPANLSSEQAQLDIDEMLLIIGLYSIDPNYVAFNSLIGGQSNTYLEYISSNKEIKGKDNTVHMGHWTSKEALNKLLYPEHFIDVKKVLGSSANKFFQMKKADYEKQLVEANFRVITSIIHEYGLTTNKTSKSNLKTIKKKIQNSIRPMIYTQIGKQFWNDFRNYLHLSSDKWVEDCINWNALQCDFSWESAVADYADRISQVLNAETFRKALQTATNKKQFTKNGELTDLGRRVSDTIITYINKKMLINKNTKGAQWTIDAGLQNELLYFEVNPPANTPTPEWYLLLRQAMAKIIQMSCVDEKEVKQESFNIFSKAMDQYRENHKQDVNTFKAYMLAAHSMLFTELRSYFNPNCWIKNTQAYRNFYNDMMSVYKVQGPAGKNGPTYHLEEHVIMSKNKNKEFARYYWIPKGVIADQTFWEDHYGYYSTFFQKNITKINAASLENIRYY